MIVIEEVIEGDRRYTSNSTISFKQNTLGEIKSSVYKW